MAVLLEHSATLLTPVSEDGEVPVKATDPSPKQLIAGREGSKAVLSPWLSYGPVTFPSSSTMLPAATLMFPGQIAQSARFKCGSGQGTNDS